MHYPANDAMAQTTEFKFNCPSCGQHILANTAWVGRKFKCPSCNGQMKIPVATKKGKSIPHARGGASSKRATDAAQNEERPAEMKKDSGFPPLPEGPRVAALTPAIKLDIVRAVRSRIRSVSTWLPGRVKGANAYAAMSGGDDPKLVDATNPKAKRFSLVGAILLELHSQRVVRTATGRLRFLEREIPEAVREVLSSGTREDGKEEVKSDPMLISHPQCLAVLDVLEDRYSRRLSRIRAERAKRLLRNVRLADLVTKLEKKARIAPEDVALALYHELTALGRRLDQIESLVENQKANGSRAKRMDQHGLQRRNHP